MTEELTVTQLKTLLADLGQTTVYDDVTLEAMLPYVGQYLRTRAELRALPLGEAGGATTMLAGGKP